MGAKMNSPWHKEMERQANDEIMVYNPTDVDFTQMVDGRPWVFPNRGRDMGDGKGRRVVPRFVARLYRKHKIDEMINTESQKLVESAKKKWKGTAREFFMKEPQYALKTNSPEIRKQYGNGVTQDGVAYSGLWIKVVRVFGMDKVDAPDPMKPKDTRPMDEQIFEEEIPIESMLSDIAEADEDTGTDI